MTKKRGGPTAAETIKRVFERCGELCRHETQFEELRPCLVSPEPDPVRLSLVVARAYNRAQLLYNVVTETRNWKSSPLQYEIFEQTYFTLSLVIQETRRFSIPQKFKIELPPDVLATYWERMPEIAEFLYPTLTLLRVFTFPNNPIAAIGNFHEENAHIAAWKFAESVYETAVDHGAPGSTFAKIEAMRSKFLQRVGDVTKEDLAQLKALMDREQSLSGRNMSTDRDGQLNPGQSISPPRGAEPGGKKNEAQADTPVDKIDWTTPDLPSRWARMFAMSLDTFKRRIEKGQIRYKKLSTKSYQIAIDDLPAKHQAKFRGEGNPPTK